MTDNASPENLRKFLESDDPALVLMGLSMAKGSGVPEEILEEILWMYLFHDDKTIRAAAKSTFLKLAPEDAKQAVKENWKASYRTDWYGPQFGILGKALCHTSVSLVGPSIKALEDDSHVRKSFWGDREIRRKAAEALGKIGDVCAVEPLVGVLSDEDREIRRKAAGALDKLGWAPETNGQRAAYLIAVDDWESLVEWGGAAVGSLIKVLGDEGEDVRKSAAEALGKIGDARAVEPLIDVLSRVYGFGKGKKKRWKVRSVKTAKFINRDFATRAAAERYVWGKVRRSAADTDSDVRRSAADALGKIGNARAIEPLIKALGDGDWRVRDHAVGALGEIGNARAVEPLIGVLWDDDGYGVARVAATVALGKIGDERAVEPLIGVLGDWERNSSVRRNAADALGMIGKPVVEPLIKALALGAWTARQNAALALVKITEANTKGKEKENILRFLESDDPAMAQMGASLLKGALE